MTRDIPSLAPRISPTEYRRKNELEVGFHEWTSYHWQTGYLLPGLRNRIPYRTSSINKKSSHKINTFLDGSRM